MTVCIYTLTCQILYKEKEIVRLHQSNNTSHLLSIFFALCLHGFSWAVLAGALYYCCEAGALGAVRKYIKRGRVSIVVHKSVLLPYILSRKIWWVIIFGDLAVCLFTAKLKSVLHLHVRYHYDNAKIKF